MICNWQHYHCSNEAEIDGLCNIHLYHRQWLDNSDVDNLGIVKFARDIVPGWMRNETPQFHREAFRSFMELYDPRKKDKYDRLLEEIAFRGGAKTTRAKIVLLYVACFGLEPFVVYASETNAFAVQDTFEVRRELGTNPKIRAYFGKVNSKAVRGQDGEWSRDAYLVMSPYGNTYVLARGVGQQVRSALRNSYRPTLALINDMYSKNSVKTEYTRGEMSKWFFEDLFNAVDDIEGKVYFNGTILHEDTVPVTLKKSKLWKVLETPVMDLNDFYSALKLCTITEISVILPPDEVIYEFQKQCQLAWPQRLDLRYILRKYKEVYESNIGSSADLVQGFFQEYFHIIIGEADKVLQPINRMRMKLFRYGGYSWLTTSVEGEQPTTFQVNVFEGVDPASATTAGSKFSALVYIAMNKRRQVFIVGYSHGKFAMRDELKSGFEKKDGDKVERDRNKIKRIGMVDEVIRHKHEFGLKATKVETIQQQQSVYDEILRIMPKNNAFHTVYGEKPQTEKIERDADILVPYFQTQSIFLNFGLEALEREMQSFPRGLTTDLIDALAFAVSIAKPSEGKLFSEVSSYGKKKDEYCREFIAL